MRHLPIALLIAAPVLDVVPCKDPPFAALFA